MFVRFGWVAEEGTNKDRSIGQLFPLHQLRNCALTDAAEEGANTATLPALAGRTSVASPGGMRTRRTTPFLQKRVDGRASLLQRGQSWNAGCG